MSRQFSNATPVEDAKTEDAKTEDARTLKNDEANDTRDDVKDSGKEDPKDDGRGFIVYRQPLTRPDGSVHIKEHGPMPVSEWANYEKENGL